MTQTTERSVSQMKKDELYRQACLWYGKYGISDRAMPADRRGFNEYFDDLVAGLEMSDDAVALREATLRPRSWLPRNVPRQCRAFGYGFASPDRDEGRLSSDTPA